MTDIRHSISIKTSPNVTHTTAQIQSPSSQHYHHHQQQHMHSLSASDASTATGTTTPPASNMNIFQNIFQNAGNKANLYENYLKATAMAQQQTQANTNSTSLLMAKQFPHDLYKDGILTPNTTPTTISSPTANTGIINQATAYDLAYRSLFQYNAACAAAAYNIYNNKQTAGTVPLMLNNSALHTASHGKTNDTPTTTTASSSSSSSTSSIKSGNTNHDISEKKKYETNADYDDDADCNNHIATATTKTTTGEQQSAKRLKYTSTTSLSHNSYESVSPSVNDYDTDDDDDDNDVPCDDGTNKDDQNNNRQPNHRESNITMTISSILGSSGSGCDDGDQRAKCASSPISPLSNEKATNEPSSIKTECNDDVSTTSAPPPVQSPRPALSVISPEHATLATIQTTLVKNTERAIRSCFHDTNGHQKWLSLVNHKRDRDSNGTTSDTKPFIDYLSHLKADIVKSMTNTIEQAFETYLFNATASQKNPVHRTSGSLNGRLAAFKRQQSTSAMSPSHQTHQTVKRQRLNDYVRVSNLINKSQNENCDTSASNTIFKQVHTMRDQNKMKFDQHSHSSNENHGPVHHYINHSLPHHHHNSTTSASAFPSVLLQTQQNRQQQPQPAQNLTNQFYAAAMSHLQQQQQQSRGLPNGVHHLNPLLIPPAQIQPQQPFFANPYLNAANRLFAPYLMDNTNQNGIKLDNHHHHQQQHQQQQHSSALAALASVFKQNANRSTHISTPVKRRRTKVTDTRLSPRTSSTTTTAGTKPNVNDQADSTARDVDDDEYSQSSNLNDDDDQVESDIDMDNGRQSVATSANDGMDGLMMSSQYNPIGRGVENSADHSTNEYIGYQTSTLSSLHLRKAKLMFFYTRYPSSTILRNYFPDVKFNKANTAQLVKWFSNFREFFYIQIERCARQFIAEGVQNFNELNVNFDSELFRVLNLHYNRNNQIEIPTSFCYVIESTLKEFFRAIQELRDQDPSWKKSIYKVIARMDDILPEYFKSIKWMESLESHI